MTFCFMVSWRNEVMEVLGEGIALEVLYWEEARTYHQERHLCIMPPTGILISAS